MSEKKETIVVEQIAEEKKKQEPISLQEQQLNKLLALGHQNAKKILNIQKKLSQQSLQNLNLQPEFTEVFNSLLSKGFTDVPLNISVIQKFQGDEEKCIKHLQKNPKNAEYTKMVQNLLNHNLKEIQSMLENLKQESSQETKENAQKETKKEEKKEEFLKPEKKALKELDQTEKLAQKAAKQAEKLALQQKKQEKKLNEKQEKQALKQEKQALKQEKQAQKQEKSKFESVKTLDDSVKQIIVNGHAIINNSEKLKNCKAPIQTLICAFWRFCEKNPENKKRVLLHLNAYNKQKIVNSCDSLLIFQAKPNHENANLAVKFFIERQGKMEGQIVVLAASALPENFQGTHMAPKLFAKILEEEIQSQDLEIQEIEEIQENQENQEQFEKIEKKSEIDESSDEFQKLIQTTPQ